MIGRLLRRARFMRDHRFVLDRASEYLDGELSGAERERLEHHRSLCPICRRMLHTLAAAVAELTTLRAEARVGVADGILERLREEPRAP